MTAAADPTVVFDLATAFWRSSVLFSACDMELFDLLDTEPATLALLVDKTGASQRGLFGMLESCVNLGLLTKDGSTYSNSPTATAYLTTASPESLLVTLKLQAATYPMWMGLTKSVRTGDPAVPPGSLLGGDKALTRHFVIGMHQRALGVAKSLVDALDLSDRKLLADIGGGPGTYSVMLVRKYAQLRSRVMDLPPILEVSRELIDESEVGDRIETVPCNVETDDLGEGYDAALVSGLLHRMSKDACSDILTRVYAALPDGGLVAVNDLFSVGSGPEMAVLFGLQMLLTNQTGLTHSVDDMADCLKQAGFRKISTTTLPPPLPHSVVSGIK